MFGRKLKDRTKQGVKCTIEGGFELVSGEHQEDSGAAMSKNTVRRLLEALVRDYKGIHDFMEARLRREIGERTTVEGDGAARRFYKPAKAEPELVKKTWGIVNGL